MFVIRPRLQPAEEISDRARSILQVQIPYPSSKDTPNTLPLAAGTHPGGRAICTNSSRQVSFLLDGRTQVDGVVRLRIGLLAMSINAVKESCPWQSKLCRSVVRKKVLS